ncbi:HNH endonuclease [Burkholderia gladioli]|uniref:HNH endonuclease n=1 Tax=Burkholderia gladioli TaxID=28095 RepID=UPI0016409D82|nr:HNH endonuclease [Burkholderia gladioli]
MKPTLTHEYLVEHVHYDAETGVFTRIKTNRTPALLGPVKGNPMGAGYLALSIGNRQYYMHRLAWFYVHGKWPARAIDHINGDRTDNRLANLRDVSQAENMQNVRRPKAYSSTGLLGVAKCRDKFRAEIRINGRKKHLGTFDTAESAHLAYMDAKRIFHPACSF